MQITQTSTEGLKRHYKVTVAAAEIDRTMTTRLGEIAKDLRLPGFRPGKVPVSIVKKRYGASLMGEVLEKTVSDSSAEAIRQHQLRPALQPKIEIESFSEGADLVFAMAVEVLPEIETIDLSSIALERLKPEITETEIDEAVTRLAERYRGTESAEAGQAAELGDIATIDAKGSIDGVEFPGGTVAGHDLELGSGQFIPGFEDQLVGAKAGEQRLVHATFPEDYQATELAGKEAVFEVTVQTLKRKLPAAVDAALAEKLGFDTIEELRETVKGQIERDYAGMARQLAKRRLLDLLAERFSFEVPAGMVELEFEGIWKQYEEEKKKAVEAGTFEEDPNEPQAKIEAEYRQIAERRVRLGLVLAEIGRIHAIQVTQDELNRAIAMEARRFGEQARQVFEYYREHPEAANMLRAPILEDKVVDFIFEKGQITEKAVSTKELVALAEADDEDDAPAGEAPVSETAGLETPGPEAATEE